MKQRIVIEEKDWNESRYKTFEWEQSVEIINWEHNFETKQYIIIYKEKS